MKNELKNLKRENLFYFRSRLHNRILSFSLFLGATILLLLFVVFFIHFSTAPLWSLLFAPIFVFLLLCWYFFGFDSFLYFDEASLSLYGGNTLSGRMHLLAPIGNYFEVSFIPSTREVKLFNNAGTRYVKLCQGEFFVKRFQELLTKVVEEEEHQKVLSQKEVSSNSPTASSK